MEFSFVRREGSPIQSQVLEQIEEAFSFQYPPILKTYYLKHHGASITYREFCVGDNEFSVAKFIYPQAVTPKGISVELLLRENEKNHWYGEHRIPFAADWGDDIYCWDCVTGKIYLYFPDSDEPEFVMDSIEKFFEKMMQDSSVMV